MYRPRIGGSELVQGAATLLNFRDRIDVEKCGEPKRDHEMDVNFDMTSLVAHAVTYAGE